MLIDKPEVIAALIAALIAAIGLFMQFSLAKEARESAKENDVRVAELQAMNSEGFLRLQYILGDQAAYRDARRDTLSDLWYAATNAQLAAEGIIEESKSVQLPTQIARTAEFLQEISVFLIKAKRIDSNAYLDPEDIGLVLSVQDALVRLFLALDPDADDKSSYQNKLDVCRTYLDQTMADFRSHIRSGLTPNTT